MPRIRPRHLKFLGTMVLLQAVLLGLSVDDTTVLAQRASVSGLVTSADSGDLMVGATIVLDGLDGERRAVATGIEGLFRFSRVRPGTHVLTVSFVGFTPWVDTLQVAPATDQFLEIELIEDETELGELVVETVRTAADRYIAGLETITPSALSRIPMPDVTYDLAGYLLTLPGFVSAGDRGGQLFVRGGTPTQNLVLLDGIPIYQPFHIVGFYSAFPADIISYADVYAGGFGARYGGRISSVIDIVSVNGNKKKVTGAATIAPFVTSLRVELPISKDAVSLTVSWRESVIEKVAPHLLGQELPFHFGDLFVKLHGYMTPTSSVSFTGLRTFDEGNVLSLETAKDLDVRSSSWKNEGYGIRYLFLPPDYPAMFEFAIHYSGMESEFRLTEEEFRSSKVQSFALNMQFHYLLGDTQLHYGIFANTHIFDYRLGANQRAQRSSVTSGGGFADTRFILKKVLRIEPGVRFESFSHGTSMSVGPRLRAILLPWGSRSRHQFSAAWGRYHQQIVGLNNEQDVSEVFTIWASSPQAKAVPEATHLIAGWKGRIFPWLELSAEGYRKWMKNLAFPIFSESVNGTTRFTRVEGDARGLDLKLDVSLLSFYMGASYGLAEVKYTRELGVGRTILIPGVVTTASVQEDARTFFPPHDRRHQMNVVTQYEWGQNKLSMRWQFGSGLPFTKVNGYYESLDTDKLTSSQGLTQTGSTYVSRSTLYGDRLPNYHRFDVSYERRFTFERVHATLQLGVINVMNRENIFSYNIFTGDRVNQLPLIPSLGLKIELE
ncbi:MAG: TonB-dependent receptor [Bacteroidetes bacterium]|nr:MAG: TonB-dependent receptor [Bacteroidota bacterium]